MRPRLWAAGRRCGQNTITNGRVRVAGRDRYLRSVTCSHLFQNSAHIIRTVFSEMSRVSAIPRLEWPWVMQVRTPVSWGVRSVTDVRSANLSSAVWGRYRRSLWTVVIASISSCPLASLGQTARCFVPYRAVHVFTSLIIRQHDNACVGKLVSTLRTRSYPAGVGRTT
jgi:hypothetical protein